MSASNVAQSGQSGQGNVQVDATEHRGQQRASMRATQAPHDEISSSGTPGDTVEGSADAIAHHRASRVSMDTSSVGRQQGGDSGEDGDTGDAITVVGDDPSSALAPEPAGPADRDILPSRSGNPAETQLAPHEINWDSLFHLPRPDDGLDRPSQEAGPGEIWDTSAEVASTLVGADFSSDVSSGSGTESAPGDWTDDEDEEEEEEEDHWVRNGRVIPVNGIPITNPAIPQIRHVFQNTMSNVDMRHRESLHIRYAPGPHRVVVHASPRDPSTRVANFMFSNPQGADSMAGVASISAEGLRTVIQAMRLVSAPVLGENVPIAALARYRALVWNGEWFYRPDRFRHPSNGHTEVDVCWGWENPWSPAGARSVLEMMQEAARLRGSWRVLFTARPPRPNSSTWPRPSIHVWPM